MDGTTASQLHLDDHGPAFGRWPCVGRVDLVERIAGALASGRVDGVVLRGPLGVGKTRIADEAAAALGRRDVRVHRLMANVATAAVPHGVLVSLLPAGTATGDPLAVAHAVTATLTANGRSVVLVDDLPLLDAASAGIVAGLVATGAVGLLGTARDGERLPDALAGLVGTDRVAGVTVEPLEPVSVETLLHLVLGGPVDEGAVAALAEPAAGNPLFLRELTLAALESGSLAEVGDVWRLRGELPPTTRLRELVEARFRALGAEAVDALELLALCQPLAVDVVEDAVGHGALEELEVRGLLRVSGTPPVAALAHPFHGEAVRLGLPPLRSRTILRAHLDRIAERPPVDEADAVRRARWRVAAGYDVTLPELLAAARAAHAASDWAAAADLLGPVLQLEPTFESALLCGQAMYEIGDFGGAERALAVAADTAPTPTERVAAACLRANVLLWGAATEQDALAALDAVAAADDLGDDDRRRIAAERAATLVIAGEPGAALLQIEGEPGLGTGGVAVGSPAHITALAVAGRTDEAIATAEDAARRRAGEVLPGLSAPDTVNVTLAYARMEAGDLAGALSLCEDGHARASAERWPLPQYWYALLLGRVHLLAGRAAESLRWFTRARAAALDLGLGPARRIALVGRAAATGLLGDPAAASAVLSELDACPPFGFLSPEEAIGRAWALVAMGEPEAARSALVDAVDDAVATGHRCDAVWLLHDAARLGAARDVLDRARELGASSASELVALRVEHIAALAGTGADRLYALVERFAALGFDLLAAEAALLSADRYRAAGDQRQAAAAGVRAEELARRCDGARTPLLAAATSTIVPLTDREREIALLAASGLASREIADRLFVSHRTVSNHLQKVFDKLGIRKRTELAGALGLEVAA
jgi:DNA-binding CsgD family transcriptional regulator